MGPKDPRSTVLTLAKEALAGRRERLRVGLNLSRSYS
jgi:hypothetical protein